MYNFYTLISHIIEVLKKRIVFFFIVLALFLGLYSFFFALFTIPLPEGVLGFYRMVPPTLFEYFYMVLSALISTLIVTLTFHRTKLKISPKEKEALKKSKGIKGKTASILGLTTGIFGSVCPACLGINFLLLGNVFTAQLSFLIPYIFWIQLGGIALLLLGLYFVTKSSYEKKCISCSVDISSNGLSLENKKNSSVSTKGLTLLVLVAVFIFIYQLMVVFGGNTQFSSNLSGSKNILVAKNGDKVNISKIIEVVTPKAGFETNIKWGNVVTKMIKSGVLDPVKLESVLKKRYNQEMKPQWRAILEGKNENLKINSDNAVFMMYMLWTLSKSNNNQILFDSPFVKYFKNYDIGVGKAGYGNVTLLQLTPKQQQVAKEVAENANRPCCNNSTAAPDCSHGYSALGLVELMASQNFTKQEIFDTFVKFNSFWFPETYVKNALYFKLVKGKNWNEVNKEIIAGKDYSSLSGAYKVKNYLKTNFGI